MSKLSDYLDKQKIDPRRILVASRQIEKMNVEDRHIRRAKRVVKSGKPTDGEKALAEKKPRSGRPVTQPTLDKALAGGRLTTKGRVRITRAVNRVLSQKKKKGEVAVSDLF